MSKLHQRAGWLFAAVALTAPLAAQAKLPAAVLTPEAKAKADEAKAKSAHGDKVGAYKLCLSMDRTAAHYFKTAGKDPKAVSGAPACTDPGPFVPPTATAAAPAAPVAAAAAPAAKK